MKILAEQGSLIGNLPVAQDRAISTLIYPIHSHELCVEIADIIVQNWMLHTEVRSFTNNANFEKKKKKFSIYVPYQFQSTKEKPQILTNKFI